MDELILRHLAGRTSDIEERQVARWRSASPENERHFRAVAAVWRSTAEQGTPEAGADTGDAEPEVSGGHPGSALSVPSVPPPTLESIVYAAERRRTAASGRGRGGVLRSPWMGYGLAAAAVAALALFVARDGGGPPTGGALAPVASTAGADDVLTLGLSDGSVVRLAPSSSVEFSTVAGRRQVRLRGRAFFAVTPNETPFVVRTTTGQVTVHGTRFEVRQDPDGLRVVVVEGLVRVEGADGGGVEVPAGSVAFVPDGGVPRVAERDDVWSLLDWEGGLLVFQETPLGQVAAELTRHFGRPVALADPGAASRRVTAWFDDEPMEDVVSAVCLVAAVPCQVDAGGATLGR